MLWLMHQVAGLLPPLHWRIQGYFVEFGRTTQNYTHKISYTTYRHLAQPLDRAIAVCGILATSRGREPASLVLSSGKCTRACVKKYVAELGINLWPGTRIATCSAAAMQYGELE